jgi:NTE family protein
MMEINYAKNQKDLEEVVSSIESDEKIGLVNQGGGSRGSYEIGVDKQIHDLIAPRIPNLYIGTSTGANNSVGMALAGVDHTLKTWRGIKKREDVFIEAGWWDWFKNIVFSKELDGINDWSPLYKMILKNIDKKVLKAEAIVTKIDLNTGALHYVKASETKSPQELAKAVVASSAVPGHTKPVDGHWVDGGVREQTPLMKAIQYGCDTIFVVLSNPWTKNPPIVDIGKMPKRLRFVKIILRTIEILAHEIMLNDLEKCVEKNELDGFKTIRLVVYAPSSPLHDPDNFDPKVLGDAIDRGLKDIPVMVSGLG